MIARKKKAFHHMTTQSKAVLCNVRQGGLLRDLTAFVHDRRGTIRDLRADGRIVSQGIDDHDNMIGPANANVAAAVTDLTLSLYMVISPLVSFIIFEQ